MEFEGDTARLVEAGVVAVMREMAPARAADVAEALVAGGVTALEVTADAPDLPAALAAVEDRVGEDALVGTGTVLSPATVREAVDAGARFVVSPTFDPEVVAATTDAGAVAVPAGFTPTEIRDAWTAGADLVKLFPAATGGPAHLSRVRGPLADVPLVPTGGVDRESAAAYLEAGAVAVGAGSALVGDGTDLAAVEERARGFRAVVDEVRDRNEDG
jgi:2-dehydro-3-deoxyphosphogluconate aldolase/(4S)-4-hydroxy-2-oxoglutarate aldolase